MWGAVRWLRVLPLVLVAACQAVIETPTPDPIFVPPGPTCDDPGHVTLRRLNRTEYNNTVRDLLGDVTEPANDFPTDSSGSFDNDADVLAMSPLLVEAYESTAAKVVDGALLPPPTPISMQLEAETLAAAMCPGGTEPAGSDYTCFGYLPTSSPTGVAIWEHDYYIDRNQALPADGEYTVTVRVWKAGAVNAKLAVLLDGKPLVQRDVSAAASAPDLVTVTATIPGGTHRFQIRNTNDARAYERDLGVDWIKIEGPNNPPNPAREAFRAQVFSCDPAKDGVDPCARKILGAFARKAYRRPVTDADLNQLLPLVQLAISKGDDFQTGIRLAMKRVLTSAEFIFRPELDEQPNTPAVHDVSDLELASRLSYFLWASTPDEALLQSAESGALHDPAELEAQARRMLADPKADALVESFAAQWLKLRALAPASPAADVFPNFDQALKAAMKDETTLFLKSFVREDHSLLELLDARYTYLNDRLAQHYGIGGVTGAQMQKVALTTPQRSGILGHASILTLTSPPNRTSPVRRGNWILANLWCDVPPPPPPNVPALPEGASTAGKTLRQIAEEHRKEPRCAACHKKMDPMGFAMEHYNGIGEYRDVDNGQPVDSTGVLPDGRRVDGAAQVAAMVKNAPAYLQCAAAKLLTYSLGRELTASDQCTVNALATELPLKGNLLKELAVKVVATQQFRQRRGVLAVGGP